MTGIVAAVTRGGGVGGGGGSPFAAEAFPTEVVSVTPGDPSTPDDTATATATGGTEPYTYEWVQLSGSSTTIQNSAGQSARFFGPGGFACNVTDAAAATVQTNEVTAT